MDPNRARHRTDMADPADNALPWPPEYSVRVSKKARHARLRILPQTGLEVVLPAGIHLDIATVIVEKNREWIGKTLAKMRLEAPHASTELPQSISLNGGSLILPVIYGAHGHSDTAAVRLRAGKDNAAAAASELQDWARRYAGQTIGATVATLAREFGMVYGGLRFRRQKSRWGSCTASGSLSLNTCLIFLPAGLARHVILHELAHTRHMNHGPGFWKTLFAMEPDALALDRRLRSAWKHVPGWMWL